MPSRTIDEKISSLYKWTRLLQRRLTELLQLRDTALSPIKPAGFPLAESREWLYAEIKAAEEAIHEAMTRLKGLENEASSAQ